MLETITHPRVLFDLLKGTYQQWSEDKASRLAAALAYYTAFSVAPLLLIAIAIAGFFFGQQAAQGQVYAQLEGVLGAGAATTIQNAVANSAQGGAGTLATIIGIVTLVWSASNVFAQLQDALNTIWEVQPDPEAGIMSTVKQRAISMTMVLGIGFILLVSLVLSAAISLIGNFFTSILPGGSIVWQVINFLISFGIITLLFAAIYKVLPDVEINWSDVWIGGAVTALLFVIGKLLIGLYLGHASVGSTFGAAGSLLVFLVWVYYSAQILFFGAEFTQVYASRFGSRIVPSPGAVPLTEQARAQQGMPRQEAVKRAAHAGRDSSGRHVTSAEAAADDMNRERELVGAGAGSNGHAHLGGHASGRAAGGATAERATTETSNGRPSHGGAGTNGHTNGHTSGQTAGIAPALVNNPAMQYLRRQQEAEKLPKGQSGPVKNLLWAGLVSGSMALGTAAAHQASKSIWRLILNEDPPIKKGGK